MNSPSLSAICLTFARNCHLEEAIACFDSQRADWPIELLIYNTCPKQTLSLPPEFQRENIRIINCQTRPASLGESRNLAIAAAGGTHICTWDDDDLYLPNYLQNFIRHFADNDWCWMSAQFYSLGWQIKSITGGGQNVVAFTKDAWEKTGRYSALNCGEDRDFVGRLTSKCKGTKIELQPGEISFIYSWDNACYHVSGAGDDAGQKNNAWKRAEHDFLTRVKLGKAKTGPITLQPHLKHDYQRMATEFVSKLSAMNTPVAVQSPLSPVQNAISRALEGVPTLFHAVERHQERISVNIARKQHAWTSWQQLYDREGVIPRHYWKYERSAKDIGDTLDLPYFKDVLRFGMEPASDNDIIVWTNDDTILHPAIVGVLRRHLAEYPVVMMARCEFRHPPARNSTPEFWAKADRDRNHNGRDLIAFRKSWLIEHWDEIPDFLLGASEFDVFMTVFIRHFYGINTPRHSLNETKFPAELPRGHVGHIKHSTQWNTLRRYGNAPAQKHNIRLYSENTGRYLHFHPKSCSIPDPRMTLETDVITLGSYETLRRDTLPAAHSRCVLAVFPFCPREILRLLNLLKWIDELEGPASNLGCVLLAASQVDIASFKDLQPLAATIFQSVNCIRQTEVDERGWPMSPNSLFRVAAKFAAEESHLPFLWNETDCIPIRQHWLKLISLDYSKCGKPFMGYTPRQPFKHLTGCAVYPPNIADYNPAILLANRTAWDVSDPHITLKHAHHSELWHHDWGDPHKNTPPTFQNIASLARIPKQAVLLHRNKDHTLIERLREVHKHKLTR